MSLVLVRAAAGCGKTTELARRYLQFVADGIEVERAIAITYTRRAAAELVERVTLALRASLTGPVAEQAQAELGRAWPLYRDVAPSDPELARRALASLPSAPIGTTDRFVHALLTEHALYAAVPVPGGDPAPIDVPITPTAGLGRHLERAARRILDPPEGGLSDDVRLLTRYFGLDTILGWLSQSSPYDRYPVARTRDVMARVAHPLAALLREHDIAATWEIEDPTSVASVEEALRKRTNKAGRWAISAVSEWIAAGCPDPAPFELAGWLKGLDKRGKARQAVQSSLEGSRIDVGPARLSLSEVVGTMRYPYDDRSHVELADTIQDARERLRTEVVRTGLESAAAAGELDHHSLNAAAIALCREPPPRLRNRYAALLVDEVQDANPEQLELYEALGSLPSEPSIQTVMVGDVRQSVYLFRGAEPAGFASLVHEAEREPERLVDLRTNFRSHRALVEAHPVLFGAIAAPMRAAGYAPLDHLDGLQSHPSNDGLALDPAVHTTPEPVWIVLPQEDEGDEVGYAEMNQRAVHAFYGRVGTAWTEAGHEADTAVVLTPTWAEARRACQWIRAWTGRDDAAFVDGGSAWLSGPVGSDLRLILRALLDPTDDVAWLGLWKHPMVGLSDAATARVRAGVGLARATPTGTEPAPEWTRRLGRLTGADLLTPPHDPTDVAAFARANPPIRQALRDVGRRDLAGVLDQLAHALDWRTLLLAGPEGEDDIAAFEVALDLVRELEAEGAAPDAVLAALQDADGTDLPRVHLDRPAQSVSCTTIFQAKGLAWDHVCVLSPGRTTRRFDGSVPRTAWLELEGQPHRIVGLKFDPTGALSDFKDPVGRLGTRIAHFRHEEECARLAYVAITRARRSVTFGLPTSLKYTQPVQEICARAWISPELLGPSVAHVRQGPVEDGARAPSAVVAVAPEPAERPTTPEARSWSVRQPSSYASHHDVHTRQADAELYANQIRLAQGLTIGAPRIDPDTEAWDLPAWQWGELAHGWLAHWGFRGPVRERDAAAWLLGAWGTDDPALARWLVRIADNLAEVGGPLWERVSDPKARLWFEHPFVGVAGRRDDVVLSGRMDLLVKRGRSLTVIDFKAGEKSPTGWEDLVAQARLKTYGPQLEAYRSALITAGHRVDVVGLWFVRTGTQVLW